jgi:hypothetical protein
MNASEPKSTESSTEESPSTRRTRRTPSKFGSYYELEVNKALVAEEEEDDELIEEDDSDEDPSWVQFYLLQCSLINRMINRRAK